MVGSVNTTTMLHWVFLIIFASKNKLTMAKLVYIDACVRENDSRTRRIAEPIIKALGERYEISTFRLPEMNLEPLSPAAYADRAVKIVPEWAAEAARTIAEADRIVIAAPFWDMSFPSVLKVFFEQTSLFGITFDSDDKACYGLCKCKKVLYITTRGMDIPTGDPREQGTPYIKALSTLWNLGELETIAATNMDYSTPEEIEAKVSGCIAEGLEIARDF